MKIPSDEKKISPDEKKITPDVTKITPNKIKVPQPPAGGHRRGGVKITITFNIS